MTGRALQTAATLAGMVLALAGCSLPDAAGEPATGSGGRVVVVERVVDGDTLAVSGDERVRLLSLDAPELNSRSADPPECGAEQARDALAVLLPAGTEVTLAGLEGESGTDRYGRTLSNVYLSRAGEVTNVSLWLVGQGWAQAYDAYPTSETAEAERYEAQARAAGLGIWGSC